MKLEVGKKYIVRDPETAGTKYIRIDCIRPESELGCRQVCATIFLTNGDLQDTCYGLNGNFLTSGSSEYDIIAEYEESKLQLTQKDIGKIAILNDGSMNLIEGWDGITGNYIIGAGCIYYSNGKASFGDFQVMKVIPVER